MELECFLFSASPSLSLDNWIHCLAVVDKISLDILLGEQEVVWYFNGKLSYPRQSNNNFSLLVKLEE